MSASGAGERAESNRLRLEFERLERENADLRARLGLDEQLGSDAARYEVIVANLAEGVVLQSADGDILACNIAAEKILGLSADQMVGRTSLDPRWRSIHEDGSEFPGETHPAMVSLRTGDPMHDVLMGVHKPDGTLTWISINTQPLFGSDRGSPFAVVASFTDVTTVKQSEARARASEEKLRFALQAAGMGAWEWDVESDRVEWSGEVEAIFGLEPGSFAGSLDAYLALIHPDDRGCVESTLQRTLARSLDDEGSDDFIMEYRVRRPDGSLHWLASFGRLIRDARGEPMKMAGTVADISTRKALEDQLLLARRMETVGRLAGGVAHDFNNLLTAILGCAEIVEGRTGHDPVASDALEVIREASEKAAGLTRQLLGFARRQVFRLESFDLCNLVVDTERLLSRVIGENIQIRTRIAPSKVLIRADRAQIEQILINLAVNARDAMPRGGVLVIHVGIASLATGPHALLDVRDCGEGIPADTLPHIFDPFFTTKQSGTGLGLSTCYGIVKQLGGDILVDSEPGRGTRFTIHLPLAGESMDDVAKLVVPAATPGQGRILLTEDDPVLRRIAERGLAALGYEVLTASNGRVALELLAARPGKLDLLISDIVMPNMSGYELAERLREQQPDLKVLFVSGYDEALDREGRVPAVAGAIYLAKPYTVSRLAGVVGQMLARRAL